MVKGILVALIRLYQRLISPMLVPSCRFHPTCSEYAVQAIQKYGPAHGMLKAAWRILRCNPFHPGGFDPA
jgi:uncharacterized protein